jgi:hypothetical protein
MIDPAKLVLEAMVLVAALVYSHDLPETRSRRFVLGFTALTVVLNSLFYYFAVWPFFLSSGISKADLQVLVLFDIPKWGVLAYVLSGFAARVADAGFGGGFALLRSERGLGGAVLFGIFAGVAATAASYGLSFTEYRMGILEALPWPFMKENPGFIKLGLWGGLRNLTGEEILTRLGTQSILLYALRKNRAASVLAILMSSLFFEFWHNGLRELYFLNFAASCAFAWAYKVRGYESAAIAHAVADLLVLVILPHLLF